MLLALASLGALIYFIHHVSESLQASHLLGVIRREVDVEIVRMFPETVGEPAADPEAVAETVARERATRGSEALVVRCGEEGYLRWVDEEALAKACAGLDLAYVPVQIGERLQRDAVILRGWSTGRTAPEHRVEAVQRAFQLDRSRSTEQDPGFGIAQMVDIAVKALSAGINDPTTAEQALGEIFGALGLLVRREMPNPARALDSRTRYLFAAPTFDALVDEGLSQIRRAARNDLHVTVTLLGGLRELAMCAGPRRAAPLRWQARQILHALPRAGFTPDDEASVRRAATAVLDAPPRAEAGEAEDLDGAAPRVH